MERRVIKIEADTKALDNLGRGLDKLTQLGQSQQIEAALEQAGQVVTAEAKGLVSQKARRHPRGQLAEAVTTDRPTVGPEYASVRFGWKETALRGKVGSGQWIDGRGYKRKMKTVDDYARILEYSDKRQLRHMEEGLDRSETRALDVLEKAVDAAIENCLK